MKTASKLSSILISQAKPIPFTTPSSFYHSSSHLNPYRNYTFSDIKTLKEALSLFNNMLRLKPIPPIKDYNKLLNIVVKMGKYKEVIDMFKKMCVLGFEVDDFSMNTVINCYCKLRNVKLGFVVVGSFVKRGYGPDVVSINCLIKGLFVEAKKVGSGGNRMVDDAYKLLSKMFEMGIFPDDFTYNILIQGLCDLGRWDEANALLTYMVDNRMYPDVFTFSALVNFCCKEGLMSKAENVMQLMTEFGVQPNVVTYNALLNGYCSRGQLDKAEELLNLMVEKGLEPNLISCCTMINGYCKHEKVDNAWEMFKVIQVEGFKPNNVLYSCMIQGLFSVGRCSQALELFDEMKEVGLVYDIYTYGIVLDGLLNNGRLQDATIFYHEVDSKGLADGCVGFYTSFIHGLCNNSKLDVARSIFNSLSSKRLYPDVVTYNVMMKGLCQEGLFHEAEELLDQMEKSGCVPDSGTYNTIIKGCMKHYGSCDSISLLRRIAKRDFTLYACTFPLLLQQMQCSNVDHDNLRSIQKLIFKDARFLKA